MFYVLVSIQVDFKVLLLFSIFIVIGCGIKIRTNYERDNPCCCMPCLHKGICSPVSSSTYECICPTGYYGKNCEKSTLAKWFGNLINLNQYKKQKFALTGRLFWSIINNVPLLHDCFLRQFYKSANDLGSFPVWPLTQNYVFLNSFNNNSYLLRGIPPVPIECPTPLGIKGPSKLPDIDYIYKKLFLRNQFKPCPLKTNLIFATFSQYLAYQFLKIKSSNHNNNNNNNNFIDIYNDDLNESENNVKTLRSGINGKFKTRKINGQEFPPYLEDEPSPKGKKTVFPKWAMTNKMFSVTPFMFSMATIWLREHNRVCEILVKKYPEWNDEKLYQTAKKILLGELLTITIEEYIQHLAQYKMKLIFKPNLIHNEPITFNDDMQFEFSLPFHWHQMLPDSYNIQGHHYNLSDLVFSNNRIVFDHGLDAVIDLMGRTPAGQVTFQNFGKTFGNVMKQLIEEGRKSRLHSFNDYRKYFDLKPYSSFKDLTGDKKIGKILQDLYGDIDAVEFVVGSFLEKHKDTVIPPTMILLSGPVALRGILSNPIGTSEFWKSSTFGGKIGFDIVQKATLQKLICLNLKQNCKNNVWVSFKTPINF
ncbi:Prostaglandin G/H synthase 1 precursor, putative [Pediculus humanus corporis]|uniref:prostaglandin-endoperoxide synthase n=1 Tax=Pediculus humanus subsp. corporis TaxID=121224 RepID=E0VHJ6_PEDHC|nr:Prostaglandin G/H synthase 1 precursor, putative [Pediculus humanus corporis]EEB12882.1 Prostaglandin G/H synthase 1 precursor, putative [Pediculus humanus corporis]